MNNSLALFCAMEHREQRSYLMLQLFRFAFLVVAESLVVVEEQHFFQYGIMLALVALIHCDCDIAHEGFAS